MSTRESCDARSADTVVDVPVEEATRGLAVLSVVESPETGRNVTSKPSWTSADGLTRSLPCPVSYVRVYLFPSPSPSRKPARRGDDQGEEGLRLENWDISRFARNRAEDARVEADGEGTGGNKVS